MKLDFFEDVQFQRSGHPMKRILYLTLKAHWFALIASGEKTEEYRDYTPFWKTRIEEREYDEILFRNGYSRNSPFMRVEYCGWHIGQDSNGKPCYVLELGRVLEVRTSFEEASKTARQTL